MQPRIETTENLVGAGETLVIPVIAEEIMVEKRVVEKHPRLVEELHITMTRTEQRSEHTVTIRREAVHTEPLGVITALPNTQG